MSKLRPITDLLLVFVFSLLFMGMLAQPLGLPPRPLSPLYDVSQMSSRQVKTSLRLSFLGDVMAHDSQIYGARQADGGYDFSPSFAYIAPHLAEADLVVANLETTLAGPAGGYQGYPRFRAPDALGLALKEAGVDVVVHTNNHSLDAGLEGLIRTRETISQLDMLPVGSRLTEDEDTVSYLKKKGINLAFVSGTYGTNGLFLPADKAYMLNDLDKDRLILDTRRASQSADLVIAYLHMGTEYATSPNPGQKELAQALVKEGAHAVMISHPHVVQTDGFIDQSVVVYSLGNCISAQRGYKRRTGMVYDLSFVLDHLDGSVAIKDLTYLPIFSYRRTDGSRPYVLGPASDQLDLDLDLAFSPKDKSLMVQGLAYLKETIKEARPLPQLQHQAQPQP